MPSHVHRFGFFIRKAPRARFDPSEPNDAEDVQARAGGRRVRLCHRRGPNSPRQGTGREAVRPPAPLAPSCRPGPVLRGRPRLTSRHCVCFAMLRNNRPMHRPGYPPAPHTSPNLHTQRE